MIAAKQALKRVRENNAVFYSASTLIAIAIIAIITPLISANEYITTDFDRILHAPELAAMHLFGTDDLGRDLLVRTMMGIRVTMLVAIIASAVSLVIGVLYGAIAGYVGGRVDAVMMRIVDTRYSLPFSFFVIWLMGVF